MDRHDREQRTSRSAAQRSKNEATPGPGHPLLDLQLEAGNTAVAKLLALQRHSLRVEEEAGD